MKRDAWFELSLEGWRRSCASLPLWALALEGLCNSLDAGAARIELRLTPDDLTITDDAPGLLAPELATTLSLGRPQPRGRGLHGRGLKRLLAAFPEATLETAGTTLRFDAKGLQHDKNDRPRGTTLRLHRPLSPGEREEALRVLRSVIPPRGVTVLVNQQRLQEPALFLSLSPLDLETEWREGDTIARGRRAAEVRLYTPRKEEPAQLFELGIPAGPTNLPWHIDVQQRLPRPEGASRPYAEFLDELKLTLFEALVPRHLDRRDLRADWVFEVLGSSVPSAAALDAYISKSFPKNAVLNSSPRWDERARHLGAHIIETMHLPLRVCATLGTALERSDRFVQRREQESPPLSVKPTQQEAWLGELARFLASRLLGFRPRIAYVAQAPGGVAPVLDVAYRRDEKLLVLNTRGRLQFETPLSPQNLALLLHELARERAVEGDPAFLPAVEDLMARAALLLANEMSYLHERIQLEIPLDPDSLSSDGATQVAKMEELDPDDLEE